MVSGTLRCCNRNFSFDWRLLLAVLARVTIPNNAAYFIFFLVLVFGGLSVTLWIATIFLIIRRFKGAFMTAKGINPDLACLSEHQIIIAKL